MSIEKRLIGRARRGIVLNVLAFDLRTVTLGARRLATALSLATELDDNYAASVGDTIKPV